MAELKPFESLYSRVHDVGIFGAGYAGYAAAVRLAAEGKRVFLADMTGGLLWESGRAFFPEAGARSAGFDFFLDVAARISGVADDWVDGATAELAANELLRDSRLPLLYYVSPVAVEWAGDAVAAVIVATKSGLRRLVARQWVDATEEGTLAAAAGLAKSPRAPDRLAARLLFQNRQWHTEDRLIRSRDCPDCWLAWQKSGWSAERALQIDMPGTEPRFLRHVAPTLATLRSELKRELDDAYVSHASFLPFPFYGRGAAPRPPASNLVLAVPGYAAGPVRNLGDRYRLGHEAAGQLADLPSAKKAALRSGPIRLPAPVLKALKADVAIAGLGTGGVTAALAAARAGAAVTAFEPFSFAGGIGTGGGIPVYYWGSAGGLQQELDDRVRALMPLFADRASWPVGFHPDAKRVVLDELLHESGVRVRYGALLAGVEKSGRRVTATLLASPRGLVRLEAGAWIDATGDGDLAALAGAKGRFGRAGDGQPQPYSQSCGHFNMVKGRLVAHIVNIDHGTVDPVDSEDATRARSDGMHALFVEQRIFNSFDRLTHISPMLGVRQGRLMETDYRLTLDDLVERRRFPDCVGYTGAHYDNHAPDYEFESDDAFFFVNALGLWGLRTACEIPYRMLLPRGLENLWIGCRAAGVTEEAHHSFRMQPDLQRIGEVCGLAAALAGRRGSNRSVPFSKLRARLEASGALPLKDPVSLDFGKALARADFADLPGTHPGLDLWLRYRKGPQAEGAEWKKALRSKDPTLQWKAALLLGAWGDPAAEPRLVAALGEQEIGPEHDASKFNPARGCRAILPRWWLAVNLLRRCGSSRCLPALLNLGVRLDLPLHLKTALILTLAALAGRARMPRDAGALVEAVLNGLEKSTPDLAGAGWQVAFAAARARAAWKLPQSDSFSDFKSNPRAVVRRAFKELV